MNSVAISNYMKSVGTDMMRVDEQKGATKPGAAGVHQKRLRTAGATCRTHVW